ncbi:MAG: alpha/beta fold hydrolase [Ignavibacteria bacterium]|nr:alpha/beta fold hydrolase [Ignavibacteria bacterium]
MSKPLDSVISGSGSVEINTSLYIPDEPPAENSKYPLLIFAHGFKGFKDWGGFPYLCNKLAEGGFAVLSFNFSHNGVNNSSPMDFTELDKFAENTHTIELEDYKAVLNYIPALEEKYPIDAKRVGLMGHSRGGGLSIITATENNNIVKALVTLASVADFNRYTAEQKKRWRQKGFIEMPNTRTNQLMKMNLSLLDDIESNSKRLSITDAASKLKIPYLIIHGKEDLAVKFTDAEKIYNSSDTERTKLHIIDNTGHTFGIEHPFKGTNRYFDEAIKLTIDFFSKNLK